MSIVMQVRGGAGMIHLIQSDGENWRIFYECISLVRSKITTIYCEREFNSPNEAVAFVLGRIRARLYPLGFDGYSGNGLKRIAFLR
jgi:hypothetical protein